MTIEELNYIKDAFSQIIDDIAGNPDWYEAARAVASDLGTLERKLEEKVSSLPPNLDEVAEENSKNYYCSSLETHNETDSSQYAVILILWLPSMGSINKRGTRVCQIKTLRNH